MANVRAINLNFTNLCKATYGLKTQKHFKKLKKIANSKKCKMKQFDLRPEKKNTKKCKKKTNKK